MAARPRNCRPWPELTRQASPRSGLHGLLLPPNAPQQRPCPQGQSILEQDMRQPRKDHAMPAAPIRRASPELPVNGFALVVDGLVKAEFSSKDRARRQAADLKSRFPMLQVRVYDAESKRSENIALATTDG